MPVKQALGNPQIGNVPLRHPLKKGSSSRFLLKLIYSDAAKFCRRLKGQIKLLNLLLIDVAGLAVILRKNFIIHITASPSKNMKVFF